MDCPHCKTQLFPGEKRCHFCNKRVYPIRWRNWFVILMLVLFYPVGVYLMWKHKRGVWAERTILRVCTLALAETICAIWIGFYFLWDVANAWHIRYVESFCGPRAAEQQVLAAFCTYGSTRDHNEVNLDYNEENDCYVLSYTYLWQESCRSLATSASISRIVSGFLDTYQNLYPHLDTTLELDVYGGTGYDNSQPVVRLRMNPEQIASCDWESFKGESIYVQLEQNSELFEIYEPILEKVPPEKIRYRDGKWDRIRKYSYFLG